MSKHPTPALNAEGLVADHMLCERGFTAKGEVRLRGAHIARLPLRLRDRVRLFNTVSASPGHPFGRSAPAPDGEPPALDADGPVEQDMFCCDDVEARGEVRLVGAHVGVLRFSNNVTLRNRHGFALNAEALTVERALHCECDASPERFIAIGGVSLRSAVIRGTVNLTNACLISTRRPALEGEGLKVDQDMYCEGLTADIVRLPEARIGEDLVLNHARLKITDTLVERCLSEEAKELARVDATALEPMRNSGGVLARGADLTSEAWVYFRTELSNVDEVFDRVSRVLDAATVLNLREAKVVGRLELQLSSYPDGVADFRSAQVGVLADEQESWPKLQRLQGFTYGELDGKVTYQARAGIGRRLPWSRKREPKTGPVARLRWLERNPDQQLRWLRDHPKWTPRSIRRKPGEYVYAQPYEQLVKYYRRVGRNDAARDVAIEKRRRQRREQSLLGVVWSFLADLFVSYGYRPWRAVIGLLLTIGVGWAVFAWASWEHLRETAGSGPTPRFQPLLYSVDSVLPVINLQQKSAWAPLDAAQWWHAISVVNGWVAVTALLAALTVMVTRGEPPR